MKRKQHRLIEILESDSLLDSVGSNKKPKMSPTKDWLTRLKNSEKSSYVQGKLQKVHYKFDDNSEMVEEYNLDTMVVIRRAWKRKGTIGDEKQWEIEVGDPEMSLNNGEDFLRESNDQPIITRRNTRINLEWRIRNLPYPIEIYSVAANADEKCIIIKTTNKKYYKKLNVPELERINVLPVQANIEYTHKFNTLIITYKKPQELLDLEKAWLTELKNVKANKDQIGDCNPS